MDYDNLTRREAKDRLKAHDEAEWEDERLWREVIEPADVLYWLDAFGDQSLAINCQGLPKGLPSPVVTAINEFDVFNDWTGTVDETVCPICNITLYRFDFDAIYPVIDEAGNHHDYVEHISDPAGHYWDSTGEHDIMCSRCREDQSFSRMFPNPTQGEVRVFYGDEGEFSRFSHNSGVVRWDFEWDMDYPKSTDLYNLRERHGGELISGSQIAAAFAGGTTSRNAMMERLGFERIHVKDIQQSCKGVRRFWRYAKEVLTSWARLDSETMSYEPTHPDLEFTYIIEGEFQVWVPKAHRDKFEAELVWQSLRKANDHDGANQYREENDALLATTYYGEPA